VNNKLNKNTATFFGRNGYLLLASAWLFTISFIIDNYWSGTATINAVQKSIQRNIRVNQKKSKEFFNNTVLINKIINRSYDEKELNDFVGKDFFFFIYRIAPFAKPQPIFWNTQIILPDSTVLDKPDGNYFQELINGWYVTSKKSFENSNGLLYEMVSLIPVKWNYYIENKYLQNSFIAVDSAEANYDISPTPTGTVVKGINGEKLFYLEQVKINISPEDNIVSIWIRIIAGMLVLFFVQNLARYYYEKKGFLPSFLVLIASIALLRVLSYVLPIPLNFRQLELFNPHIYGSGFIFHSLGDLFINSLLFIWVVLFIRSHYKFEHNGINFNSTFKRYAAIGFISLLMIIITIVCGNIVRSLVSDSLISFDVINFFTINNIYSVIGFIVLSCVATGYFFLIQILLQPVKKIVQPNWFVLYLSIAVIGLIFLTFSFHSPHITFNLYLLGWLLLFVYLLNKVFLAIDAYNLISTRFVFWLFFFSISITTAIVVQNRKKELDQRKAFAENIAMRADPTGEKIINVILNDFNNEALQGIFDRFKSPGDNRFLKDSLINENFSGYINNYDTRIYTFDEKEAPLFNQDSTNFNSLNAIIQTQGKKTGIPDLYYYDISYDRFNYITKKEFVDSSGHTKGYIFIVSTPKKYKSDALYPELFSKGSTNSIESSSIYAFAIYNDNQLSNSNNDYPFPTTIDPSSFTYNDFRIVNRNGYEELWYRANEDKIIVIARQSNLFIEAITLFAYLFCSFLVITILFNFLNKLLVSRLRSFNFKSFWQFTIRNQVHGTIIIISIFSFIVIGITTILFFISRYHSNNREKLSRTIHVMENEIRNSIDTLSTGNTQLMEFDSVSEEKLDETINSVAAIHDADINLYDLNGDLKVSSLPLPYKKGIVSQKMDPVAFFHLNKLQDVQYSQEQLIGSLEYLSNYVPVRDETGKEYAYLNIPYFESQSNLQDEISNFLVTIINLNAFIFLIAGIIAVFITNRITRSFSLISNKMKEVNLEKTNEEIVWNRKDEIGELVNEYNKMVRKLDVSAQLLAKSEREGAWREMARQVAHEIKNPLTPMKLNLQYLQMAIDNNSPGVKKISSYVANILLEQIEHLSKIASDFAQFANLGNTKNQLFDINRTLINVASLYSANEKLKIDINLYHHEIIVEADKTQINRLFTNLLQNAVQSVPESRKAIIEIKSQLTEKNVLVSVKDNGNGIPAEMYSKIFIPNFTTKTSGTGLGLAMCKGIVEKLNGKIWFETDGKSWTIFFVELPIVDS
jgi:two-component system nitrogen regulation sensor histidine kinase NtrY